MTCQGCATENASGSRFCGRCGTALSRPCGACGTLNDADMRFCTQCGTGLADAAAEAAAPRRADPAAERRLVSVLFVDLVGFTTLSDTRDAEEVRELLSRYFDLARTLIERYGGTVEKFIGDAVMAVWGTPTATEDDAERAVRAALDLVASVGDVDPALQARAGVLTGEAAVTVGAEGQGMVAGDLVNTASRVQGAAEPGTVLVGESTRRASEQAIAYESAGVHELKGKAEPVPLHRALRVVSALGGQLRSARLEAPFVGRERELKLIKDMFYASAEDRRAHLVSVTGLAGIGKSRLAWEFYKYFDGIVEQVFWHRGRCLAYGEGVAYWALADMVRMRCRIGEQEEASTAREKLAAALEEHLPDPEERSFVEPRLAHLLGLEERAGAERQDLFAAWRLFFERLSDQHPTVLAFEDMQWADTSLLDFIEYLLEWSRDHPLYVITLARPELHERRPGWGAGQRTFTSLYLEPLPPSAMEALLDGLVPGLPESLRAQILDRAEGVPLYAVETVRMLLDKGLLEEAGAAYRTTGDVGTLEVPETLHALIAARLDGVAPDERRLLQDGAVLGKTFTARALSALTGMPELELEPVLLSLVRKEVLGVQADPRSPEHGQFGFLQDLVRHVAYGTLSRRERKARHMAAAAHLETAFADVDEVAEVLATHYVAAFEAAPEADDAPEVRERAAEMLTRAGQRARSLGAPEEGRRYYERAAVLVDDPLAIAELLEQAGRLAILAGRAVEAREQLERAVALRAAAGDTRGVARASAALADSDVMDGRLEAAAERLEQVVAQLEPDGPSAELAIALSALGRMRVLAGHADAAAAEPLERALALAERFLLPEVFVEALNSKSLVLSWVGRLAEGQILVEAAAARAHEEQLYTSALRAENNLTVNLSYLDRHAEALEREERAYQLAARLGDRRWMSTLRAGSVAHMFALGRWDDALAVVAEEQSLATTENARSGLLDVGHLLCERGRLDDVRSLLAEHDDLRRSDHAGIRVAPIALELRLLRATGRPAEALAIAERTLSEYRTGGHHTIEKDLLVQATEAALEIPDTAAAERLLAVPEGLDRGELMPYLEAHARRLRARLDAMSGKRGRVQEHFRAAASIMREFGLVFDLAVTDLEHAEWLTAEGRAEEARPLLADALATFERLEATPWIERAAALAPAAALV